MLSSTTIGRWTRRAAAMIGLVTVALAAAPAATASAATVLPCTTRTTTKPFTGWGDGNGYFTLPGGTFESSPTSAGWTLSGGAAVTTGNEPWKVIAGTNASSLKVLKGAVATAPSFCVQPTEARFRLFYKSPGIASSFLVVHMRTVAGTAVTDSTYWVDGSTAGWALSPALQLPNVGAAGQQVTATVWFDVQQQAGTWQIDDVEVDPWKTM